jgi:hypothetical protein
MKKIFLIFTLATIVISCSEDFLERYPHTSLVVENFYKTPADASQALTSVYNMLLRDDWWSAFLMSEASSDNCAGGAGTGDGGGYQRWDRHLQWPEANANQDIWRYYFGGLYRANIYLENEKFVNWSGKETLQKQYIAEARFLRAYFHFYLTQVFGEIPIIDHPLAPGEIPGRSRAEDIYKFIIDDLKYCALNGLSAPYGQMEAANWARATRWAADAMLARVYLFYSGYYNDETIGDFNSDSALVYIDDVIINSGHDLVPEFASLWKVPAISELGDISQYAGEVNPEVVWSVRFESTGNPSQWLQRMIGPRGTNIDPYGQGWGATPVMPTLWNKYDNADKRKTATILSWDDEGIVYDYVAQQQAQYTGYNNKKYDIVSIGGQPEVSDWQQNGSEDLIIIRFADVLLMGAELHLLTGDNSTAINYINRVRTRAFGNDSYNLSAVTLIDIMNERQLELACEGLRYWDILRSCKGDFSKLASILTYVDETDGGDFSQTADVYSLDVDGNNFIPSKGLFQIPQNELDLMKGIIEQTEGFE